MSHFMMVKRTTNQPTNQKLRLTENILYILLLLFSFQQMCLLHCAIYLLPPPFISTKTDSATMKYVSDVVLPQKACFRRDSNLLRELIPACACRSLPRVGLFAGRPNQGEREGRASSQSETSAGGALIKTRRAFPPLQCTACTRARSIRLPASLRLRAAPGTYTGPAAPTAGFARTC